MRTVQGKEVETHSSQLSYQDLKVLFIKVLCAHTEVHFWAALDAVKPNSDALFKIHPNILFKDSDLKESSIVQYPTSGESKLIQTTEKKLSLDTDQHNTKCCPKSSLTF